MNPYKVGILKDIAKGLLVSNGGSGLSAVTPNLPTFSQIAGLFSRKKYDDYDYEEDDDDSYEEVYEYDTKRLESLTEEILRTLIDIDQFKENNYQYKKALSDYHSIIEARRHKEILGVFAEEMKGRLQYSARPLQIPNKEKSNLPLLLGGVAIGAIAFLLPGAASAKRIEEEFGFNEMKKEVEDFEREVETAAKDIGSVEKESDELNTDSFNTDLTALEKEFETADSRVNDELKNVEDVISKIESDTSNIKIETPREEIPAQLPEVANQLQQAEQQVQQIQQEIKPEVVRESRPTVAPVVDVSAMPEITSGIPSLPAEERIRPVQVRPVTPPAPVVTPPVSPPVTVAPPPVPVATRVTPPVPPVSPPVLPRVAPPPPLVIPGPRIRPDEAAILPPAPRVAGPRIRPDESAILPPQTASRVESVAPTVSPAVQNKASSEPSQFIKEYIKKTEKFAPKAFWDYKQYSIGYGTKANSKDEVIDEKEASLRFEKHLKELYSKVIAFGEKYKYNFTQNEADALTSFVYNGGIGWLSQVTDNGKRNKEEIQKAMLLYVNADGKPLPGLIKRRQEEFNIFRGEALKPEPRNTVVPERQQRVNGRKVSDASTFNRDEKMAAVSQPFVYVQNNNTTVINRVGSNQNAPRQINNNPGLA